MPYLRTFTLIHTMAASFTTLERREPEYQIKSHGLKAASETGREQVISLVNGGHVVDPSKM